MRVKIESIADRGDLDRERLVLRVVGDADIGEYLLIRTGFEDDHVTTEVVNAFWFPDRTISRGDLVVVYSKSGAPKRKSIRDDRTAHFFYWEQNSPLWDDEHFAPVLLYAPQWIGVAPQEPLADAV